MNIYSLINLTLNTNKIRKKFLEKIRISLKNPVLDFGCGNGDCAAFMPDNIDYIGVDNNRSRIQHARKAYPNKRFILGSFDSLEDYSLLKVQSLIFYGVFHHLSDNEIKCLFRNPLLAGKIFFSLDPCHATSLPTYNKIVNFFDRGKYIRSKNAIISLLKSCLCTVDEIALGTYNDSYVILCGKRNA